MSTAHELFPVADAYAGDPLYPDLETVTPAEVVAELSGRDRVKRVVRLTQQAREILTDAMEAHGRGRDIVARCVLFSGGDDSTAVLHLFRRIATHAVHVNTGTGIPETGEYVRDLTRRWGIPLVEVAPDDTYEDLVMGRVTTRAGERVWPGGFPGPSAHGLMYQRLKERALDKARHRLGVANSRSTAAVWIAGRRRQESDRREDIPLHESDGTVIWASPVAMWTKLDLATYRRMHDVPRNPVSEHLHMSGECLCGAFAHAGELDEIGFFYPEVAARIRGLQDRVAAAGYGEPYCQWGHGIGGKPQATGRLCQSCDARQLAFEATR